MENNSDWSWKSIFYFDTMLMSKIITFVYWIMLFGIVISGLGLIFQGSIISGLAAIVFGALGLRLWCELMIVLFKINDNIQKIADKS